ncbi:MAG: glycosyltransferase family 39 protein [Acidimicrobiales bacterium]
MHLEDPPVRNREGATSPDAAGGADPFEPLPTASFDAASVGLAWRVLVVAALLLGIFLRFWTPSAEWLDEALTVNISRQPLHLIPGLLRHDGAPPLFYVMLHYWMEVFGQSNLATRSLSGVIGLANLPVAWLTGYRVGSHRWSLEGVTDAERGVRLAHGRSVGWAVTLLLASSPFAVYYDTEARMYGLVIFLGTVLVLAYTYLLERATVPRAALLAVAASAMLWTHYWALYAISVAGVVSLWCALRGPHKRAYRYATGAIVVACLSFVPWVPTFLYQLHHTGTPWAPPAGLTAVVFALTQFAGGNDDPGRALAVLFFFFALLALTAMPLDRWRVVLDLRTRPGVRTLAACTLAAVVLGVMADKLSGTTFTDRYTAIVTFPTLLVMAYGIMLFSDARVRRVLLSCAVVFGFLGAVPNAFISRTQAGDVGNVIATRANSTDVVAFCPDQLGPAVSRVLDGRFKEIAFPRDNSPEIVDWVDYVKVVKAASPAKFVAKLKQMAGAKGTVFYVWASGYAGFGSKCDAIGDALGRWPGHKKRTLVAAAPSDTFFEIFEGDTLDAYSPR